MTFGILDWLLQSYILSWLLQADPGILISAMVAIGLSIYEYRRRRRSQRQQLRRALLHELEFSKEHLEMLVDINEYLPYQPPLPMTVYENMGVERELLTKCELEAIMAYYVYLAAYRDDLRPDSNLSSELLEKYLEALLSSARNAISEIEKAGELSAPNLDIESRGIERRNKN